MTRRPDRTEASDYQFTYIDQVDAGDICDILGAQRHSTVDWLRGITDAQSLHRYAPGKWSIRDVVCHLSDAERLFAYRAYWFARGFDSALPSFDQAVAVEAARADDRSWVSLIDEFDAVRAATLSLFCALTPEAWDRRGVASGNAISVRALAYVAAGHVAQHVRIVRERYLGRR